VGFLRKSDFSIGPGEFSRIPAGYCGLIGFSTEIQQAGVRCENACPNPVRLMSVMFIQMRNTDLYMNKIDLRFQLSKPF
jgi:hypothetical protein